MKSNVPKLLAQELGYNAYQLGLMFKRGLIRTLQKYDLSPEQWQILVALDEADVPVNQNTLASITLKDRHSTSRIIRKMETAGWIRRIADKKDSRAHLVKMSSKGKKDFPKIRETLLEGFAPISNVLSNKEKEVFLTCCAKLSDELNSLFPQNL